MKGRQAIFQKNNSNNDSEYDLGSWKKNVENARNDYQRPRRTKEQTAMNNILEGINSKITQAEEQITDLENNVGNHCCKTQYSKKNEKN